MGLVFSIYFMFENQGYTKEATKAVVDWILEQPIVKSLRMTVHPKNFTAVRIAQHAKFKSREQLSTKRLARFIYTRLRRAPSCRRHQILLEWNWLVT
jgi:RimJ/RimL family protein N-acetyltransferase